ncbi:MAG: tetratricopeptide repeat protein [Melioribacteraceae bacterium]|nr:tetratricopeptide repeat protein [Melioribacteraceae bacterium]
MKKETPNFQKEISLTKMVYFLILLAFIGMIILYATGTFEALAVSSVKTVNNTENVDHNHGSADLNALNDIRALEEQFKNNPDDLNSLLNLSHLLNDSGFFAKAIENYNKYLEKIPNNADVVVDMGVCYFQLGNYDSAIKTMERGISINPQHQIAHFNLGIVNSAKGDLNKSKEYLEKAVKIDPNSDIGIKAQNLLDNH